jgi:hypothetical protein
VSIIPLHILRQRYGNQLKIKSIQIEKTVSVRSEGIRNAAILNITFGGICNAAVLNIRPESSSGLNSTTLRSGISNSAQR